MYIFPVMSLVMLRAHTKSTVPNTIDIPVPDILIEKNRYHFIQLPFKCKVDATINPTCCRISSRDAADAGWLEQFRILQIPTSPPRPQSRENLTSNFTMAAAIKAINAKIRSNSVLDYVCSTRTYRCQVPRSSSRTEIGQRDRTRS
jgi:hypothetical protein